MPFIDWKRHAAQCECLRWASALGAKTQDLNSRASADGGKEYGKRGRGAAFASSRAGLICRNCIRAKMSVNARAAWEVNDHFHNIAAPLLKFYPLRGLMIFIIASFSGC